MSAAVGASEAGDVASSAARRRSGRVSKRPEKFAPTVSPTGSSKRKRGADNDDSGVEADATSSDPDESTEGESEDDEPEERKRKKKGKGTAKRSAAKKPKTNGTTVNLAMRPATGAKKIAKRPRKAAIRKSAVADNEEGLYGEELCPSWHPSIC